MTAADLTAIALLVDRSGSMQSIRKDAEGAIAAFLQSQQEVPGRCVVSLSDFDDKYRSVYGPLPIAHAPAYTLEPRGTTALLDAIGRLVTDLGTALADLPEETRPGKVIVVVQTDGQENASTEWTLTGVSDLITQQREIYSWDFVFLGANQDAIATGESLGFAPGSSISYSASPTGTQSVGLAMSSYVTRARTGQAAAFTDDERTSSL